MGGTLRAIESGDQQSEIHNAAYAFQKGVDRGERIVVGVNRFRATEERPVPTFHLDPGVEQAQIARLREVRASRSASEVREKLDCLEIAARGAENLMPVILDAASAYATVGEISDRLRAVFGEYRETA